MGCSLRRLEVIRSSTAPWQQKAIDEATPLLQLMATYTSDAISFLKDHRNDMWMPIYHTYVANIENNSQQLQTKLGEYLHLAKLRNEERRLSRQVGTSPAEE